MAIFGYIDDIVRNISLDNKILAGFSYLKELTPDSFLELGHGESIKVTIDGEKLFANNQKYRTKSIDLAKFEAHQKYIDLQFMVEGIEIIRNSCRIDCRPQGEYNSESDVQFFTAEFFSSITLKAGMVCILYPEDIHAPGLVYDQSNNVTKSVVKVKIE